MKEPKQYPHLALLQEDILRRRAEDKDPITRHIEVSPSNPIHLAPAIAMKGPLQLKSWSKLNSHASRLKRNQNRC